MGDCGALFIGFMLSVISLLGFGFKTSTFFTLGAPIVVLAVPIMDTLIAIIRRKVHHQRFDEADKGHLHHKLMFSLELGQTKSCRNLCLPRHHRRVSETHRRDPHSGACDPL